MAITFQSYPVGINDIGLSPMHYADFFKAMDSRLEDEITRKIKKIKGIDEGDKYKVTIRFERDDYHLRPKFYYIIQVRKIVEDDNSSCGSIEEHFMFTLSSKKPHDHDVTLKELLYEFGDLLDGFVEKLLLAEELFDRYNIHINEDMNGIDIEVDGEGYNAKYRLTKTPDYQLIADSTKEWAGYNHVTACNQKDGLVSLIVDDWMTLNEMKAVIDLVYE